jgi:hypothetical protein
MTTTQPYTIARIVETTMLHLDDYYYELKDQLIDTSIVETMVKRCEQLTYNMQRTLHDCPSCAGIVNVRTSKGRVTEHMENCTANMTDQEIIARMQYVALLSYGEAKACLRDYRAGYQYSSEAVNHYGGTTAVHTAATSLDSHPWYVTVIQPDLARIMERNASYPS